ncbi:hypothetical protein [uncultured Clostridium sp.]|uniref:hypothetical protein n=1 Tax=uncultured Clostridium sp. TaxID=59620 RepID=UPI00262DBD07|nr:hypothetical protein [uncultured Clostridium sp.]
MIIKYINKKVIDINENFIKGKLVQYELTHDEIAKIAALQEQNSSYKIQIFFLTKDNKQFDMVVDNIPTGRVLYGGIKDYKALLDNYIIENGVDELLKMLSESN